MTVRSISYGGRHEANGRNTGNLYHRIAGIAYLNCTCRMKGWNIMDNYEPKYSVRDIQDVLRLADFIAKSSTPYHDSRWACMGIDAQKKAIRLWIYMIVHDEGQYEGEG